MKISTPLKVSVTLLSVLLTNLLTAQWNTNGNNINNTNTGNVGIGTGTSTLPGKLTVRGSGSIPATVWVNSGTPLFTGFGEQIIGNADYILSMASSLSNARPVFIGRRSKGTLAVPTAVSNNDQIMSFLSSGYDGSAFQNPAAIDFFVDGTPSAGNIPARISFVTGTNSGNRTERLIISNTGNITMNSNQFYLQRSTARVGLGTTTPAAKLDVVGNIKITDGTQGLGKILTSDANGLASWSQPVTNPWTWAGNNIYNNNTGKVGIGTSNPGSNLDIRGSNTDEGAVLNLGNADNSYQMTIFGGRQNDPNPLFLVTANTPYRFSSYRNGYTELMRLDSIGRMGVGTTTPQAKLDIAGNIKITDGTQGQDKVLTSDVNGLASWQTPAASPWSLNGNNISNSNAGNVGIGTNSPLALLHVNGNGLINGLSVGKGNSNISSNTAFGVSALLSNTTGTSNTAIGNGVLIANTVGNNNTATGFGALRYNSTGNANSAYGAVSLYLNSTGNSNSAFGINTLYNNTVGGLNSALGVATLFSNTSGNSNSALGSSALFSNSIGHSNVAIGSSALNRNTNRSNLVAIGDSALYNNGIGAITSFEATANTAIGSKSLFTNNVGYSNTAIGSRVLYSNSSGYKNTATGSQSLLNNTTGGENTSNGVSTLYNNTTGNNNTAIGSFALFSNIEGSSNVAVGVSALFSNTNRDNLVAIGDSTLYNNGTGVIQPWHANNNIAIGSKALYSNNIGYSNTAIGVKTLFSNTSGFNNTATGNTALYFNTEGEGNAAFGTSALQKNTIGSYNTAMGSVALFSNTTGNRNTANGVDALYYNTTGNANTAFGSDALYKNTMGSNNVGIGSNALYSNTTGVNNSAIGFNTLYFNATGTGNTANGYEALYNNSTGGNNVAAGRKSLLNNTTGNSNIGIGSLALYNNIDHSYQVGIGDSALYTNNSDANVAVGSKALAVATQWSNTAVGYNALKNMTTGFDNVALGSDAGLSQTSGNNNIVIGKGVNLPNISGSNQIRLGNGQVSYAGINIAWTITSDKRMKDDIRPLTYGLSLIKELKPVDYVRINSESKIREVGFIAQDVDEALQKVGYNQQGIVSKDYNTIMGVRYNDFIPILTKAIQEQQILIEALRIKADKSDDLQKQIDELKAAVMHLMNQKNQCTTRK